MAPTPLTLTDGKLSPELADQYWRDGYLFPVQVFDPAEARDLRAELERVEADYLDAGLPRPLLTYKRLNAHAVMPFAARMASDPRILDVVEGILGPDIMVYGAEFFIKEAQSPHIVTMHQDLTYWGLGATDQMVTVWLALSPATQESGCMDFVQGSHKNPILPHVDTFAENNLLSRGQEIQVDVAEADKTAIEIHPGQISLHHGLTIHGSGPNVSDDRRIAFVIRYVTPKVAQEVGGRDFAMLVRGADREGNFINFMPPRGLFDDRALTLYDEIRDVQQAIKMRGSAAKNTTFQD